MFVGNRSAGNPPLAQKQDSGGQSQTGQQPADQDQSNAASDKASASFVANAAPIIATTADRQAEREQQRAEADLQAQQDMAFYALLLLIATVVTVIITAAGVWLVKRTLDATLEAVEDTGKATEAMIRQNELAEVAARPWLTLEMEHGFASDHTNSDAILFFANLKITNIGGTPAQNVSVETADVPDIIRNEFSDLHIISENMSDQFSDLEHMVVFPTTTETFQAIFSVPFVQYGGGKVAHPDKLIVVNYRLGNGTAAQTTARFMARHGDEHSEIFQGDPIPDNFRFIRAGYIRVT